MNRKLKCYYAHTMVSYGSTIEKQDIETLEELGFEVINPNTPEYQEQCQEYVLEYGDVMDFFGAIVMSCDILAFRSLPNNDILSGISFEIDKAIQYKIPVIELPCALKERMMTYPETKQYLIELGHYKI